MYRLYWKRSGCCWVGGGWRRRGGAQEDPIVDSTPGRDVDTEEAMTDTEVEIQSKVMADDEQAEAGTMTDTQPSPGEVADTSTTWS